jgi:glycosyltransferase involved in cell wall biosynthesis
MSVASQLTVIVLNDYCHINGGASRVAIDEAVGLAAGGVDVVFLGAHDPVCDALKRSNVRVVCLGQGELIDVQKSPTVALQGLWNVAAYRKMKEILGACDPLRTVVHLHGYTKALSTSPVRCAVHMGFKVVCTLHDFYTACPNGAFFNYTTRTPCVLRALSGNCIASNCDKRRYAHKLYRVARSAVQKGLGKLPSAVRDYIVLSRQSETLLRTYLPEDSRYYPLENPIAVPQLPPVNIGANDTLIAIGRLDVEKGVEILLAAAKQTKTKLLLVGDGPLRVQAEATPGCTVTGWCSPAEVMAHLECARCLVFPSLWYETYGLVVAEAAARGVPAIVSDISAASERVVHNQTGWIVRAGDAGDLAHCLSIASDNATLQAAGQAAYNRFWAAPPTLQTHIAAVVQIYRSMLADIQQQATCA